MCKEYFKYLTMERKFIIRKTVHRGTLHNDFCQDAIASYETKNRIFIGVFDGCSDGINSHFASEFFAKVFIKNAADTPSDYNLNQSVKFLIDHIVRDLCIFMHLTQIVDREMLSTIIFTIVNKSDLTGITVIIGDGFVIHKTNDEYKIEEVDQDNTPDYITYNRGLASMNILTDHAQIYEHAVLTDISICSDGLSTFFKKTISDNGDINVDKNVFDEIVETFCKDKFLLDSDAMLSRKHRMLENKGYGHQDDFSIVRIMVHEQTEETPEE